MGRRRTKILRELGHEVIEDDSAMEARPPWKDAVEKCDAVIVSTPPDKHIAYQRGLHHRRPVFTEASVIREDTPIQGVYPSCTMLFHPVVNQIRGELANTKPLAFRYHVGNYLPDWHPGEDYRVKYFSKKQTGGCREIVAFELVWLTGVFGQCEVLSGEHFRLGSLEIGADDMYRFTLGFDGGLVGDVLIDTLSRPKRRNFELIYEGHTRLYDLQNTSWEAVYAAETGAFIDAISGRRVWPHPVERDLYVLGKVEEIENID